MAQRNLGGVYANMEFKTYEYQEYPKHIRTGPHGEYKVVNNSHEEEELKAKLEADQNDAPAEQIEVVSDPERDILIARAKDLGVPINKKWSIAKLKLTISDAESEIDDLPAEEEDSKEELLVKAKSMGINARPQWSITRLKNAIAEHDNS